MNKEEIYKKCIEEAKRIDRDFEKQVENILGKIFEKYQ